jgi:hypothetical protein
VAPRFKLLQRHDSADRRRDGRKEFAERQFVAPRGESELKDG